MTSASPQLLRHMIAKNGEFLRRLLACPPADPDSEEGQRHRARIAQMRTETETLNERLQALLEKPPTPQARRKPWLEARGSS